MDSKTELHLDIPNSYHKAYKILIRILATQPLGFVGFRYFRKYHVFVQRLAFC